MNQEDHLAALRDHYSRFFEGHGHSEFTWELGPVKKIAPFFRAIWFTPGPRSDLWSCVSLGTSLLGKPDSMGLEFVLSTQFQTPRSVELLAMVAYYHHTENLGLHHTFPVGEPWQKGATCDHFLLSLPYPFGEKLEVCFLPDRSHVQVLWLLPITAAEREFKSKHGVEALEQKFDDQGIEYWDLQRPSVV